MDIGRPLIKSQNSTLRDLLPFYSVGQFAFALGLAVGVYVLMRWLDPPTATFVTAGSVIGMAAVGAISKPASTIISGNQLGELEKFLAAHGYRRSEQKGLWVSPLPRWLRWNYNRVETREDVGGTVCVLGPATVLRGLLNGLRL